MTIDVDTVCTDEQLDEFLGGHLTTSQNLRPQAWTDCRPARQHALDRILGALRRRTPPIRETDLQDVTELRTAVKLGAAEHLHMLAATSGDAAEVFAFKAKKYAQDFESEINGLTPTLVGSLRGSTYSFGISRR